MTDPVPLRADVALPPSLPAAMIRGARGCCPRCGEAKLFRKWLKPVDRCGACALDISGQRADDFPAYIALFVAGHLLAPILILMVADWELSPMVVVVTIIPLAVLFMLLLLQPAKGAVIALQWWNGMHGFRKERLPETPASENARPEDAPQ